VVDLSETSFLLRYAARRRSHRNASMVRGATAMMRIKSDNNRDWSRPPETTLRWPVSTETPIALDWHGYICSQSLGDATHGSMPAWSHLRNNRYLMPDHWRAWRGVQTGMRSKFTGLRFDALGFSCHNILATWRTSDYTSWRRVFLYGKSSGFRD
jgi:hypothetical protein